ncbi:CLIP domain-containing serine protease B4 [Anabrus simplex]|uniref:CLIP domain-containing serine protease B4 n=1 Tax=Anabrus simplex TaxID=316456 RepID=UPI0035A3BF34
MYGLAPLVSAKGGCRSRRQSRLLHCIQARSARVVSVFSVTISLAVLLAMRLMSFLFLLLLAVTAYTQNIGERCRKPSNRPGICVNIRECPVILAILDGQDPDLRILHESRCGFSGRIPVVCCPDPVVPITQPSNTNQPSSYAVQDVSNHRNVHLLPMDICGPVADARIYGGKETGLLEFPWMALIGYLIRGKIGFLCGGSLVNERYVLTAAHCVTGLESGYVLASVRLGEHNLDEETDCDVETKVCAPEPLNIDVEEGVPHPQYKGAVNKSDQKNDIALIRLKRPVSFSQSVVRPICLPVGLIHQNRNLDQKFLIVAGWGFTEKGRTSSSVQLKVNVPVVPLAKCSVIYQKITEIVPSQLCAGGVKGKDSCNGDSGGPLFFLGLVGEEQKAVQYGVVSFGPKPCGTENVPGVYTRVGHYMDWMLNNMRP